MGLSCPFARSGRHTAAGGTLLGSPFLDAFPGARFRGPCLGVSFVGDPLIKSTLARGFFRELSGAPSKGPSHRVSRGHMWILDLVLMADWGMSQNDIRIGPPG